MDISKALCPECGRAMTPVSCECERCSLSLSGRFSVSPLGLLPAQDQAIMIAFLRSFGSIKKIAEILGVSYPTARARLERIIQNLNEMMTAPENPDHVIELLARGELSFADAMERL